MFGVRRVRYLGLGSREFLSRLKFVYRKALYLWTKLPLSRIGSSLERDPW